MFVTAEVLQIAPIQLLQEHLFTWLVSSIAANKGNLQGLWQLAGHLYAFMVFFLFFFFSGWSFPSWYLFFSKLLWIIPHFPAFPLEMPFSLPFPVFCLAFFFSFTLHFLVVISFFPTCLMFCHIFVYWWWSSVGFFPSSWSLRELFVSLGAFCQLCCTGFALVFYVCVYACIYLSRFWGFYFGGRKGDNFFFFPYSRSCLWGVINYLFSFCFVFWFLIFCKPDFCVQLLQVSWLQQSGLFTLSWLRSDTGNRLRKTQAKMGESFNAVWCILLIIYFLAFSEHLHRVNLQWHHVCHELHLGIYM